MKQQRDKKSLSFLLDNFASIATIITGIIVIVGQLIGLMRSQVLVNAVIISLLCLFALSEIIQRTRKLERIENGIEELLKARDGTFTRDIDYGWSKAISMIESVEKGGCIYDTTSIENPSEYEEIIERKASEGIQITRILCGVNLPEKLHEYIKPPEKYIKCISKDSFLVYQLPYSLPVDILVTEQGNSIQAIIGLRTALIDKKHYSSAFFITNQEFSHEILNVYKSVLQPITTPIQI